MHKKIDMIQMMFVACRHSEARFLIRSLAGKLRIGLAEQSVLQALAQGIFSKKICDSINKIIECIQLVACAFTSPNLTTYQEDDLNRLSKLNEAAIKTKIDKISLILKETYCRCPDYNKIIPVLLSEGIEALELKCRMIPGIPLKPMLGNFFFVFVFSAFPINLRKNALFWCRFIRL